MYRVTIYNGTTSTVIHEPSTDPDDAHLYECSLVQGSSGEIDSLSFTITPNNPGYEKLNSYSTFIEVVDLRSKGEAAIFSGRVLSVSPQMEESGMVYKNIVCEDRLGYLCDSIQPYTTMNTYTVREFLELLLDNHNAQVEDYKKMYVGTVSFETSSGNVTKSLNYQTTWEAITGKLLELGGEIQLYTLNGSLYIDYVTELGTMGDQTIEIAKNMRSLEQDKSPTDIITRLIPLGDYLEEQTGESDDRERLTIASVNGGRTYIDDDDAIAAYGIIAGTVVWEDVTIASNLLEKGQEWLKDQSVNETVSLSAYDLYAAGIDPDVIERYNYYLTYNPLIGVNKWYRVAQKTINVIDPTDVSFTMGDQSTSLSSTVKRTGQDAADAAAAINANLSKTVATLIAGNAIIQYLQAEVAEIEALYVSKEYVDELVANDIQAIIIEAGFLTADSAVITDLTAFAANIYTLLGGEGAFGELQTAHLTADNVVIDEAVIINAIAGTILADMIEADYIDTDLISIHSEDGTLWIDGSTILIYDANGNPRIQIGLDELGDYNLALWDADGNCMWNATGATEYGLNDGVIKDVAVADDANISGYKLNIEEICSIINSSGQYEIDASSVTINGETLDAWYATITQEIEGLSLEGLTDWKLYFAKNTSDTVPPENDEYYGAICGVAICGQTICGQEEGSGIWTLTEPTAELIVNDDGSTYIEYVWARWWMEHMGGTIEWGDPFLLSDSPVRQRTTVMQTELEVVEGWISGRVWYTEIIEAVNDIIEEDVWSELNIWLNGIELEVGDIRSEFTNQYETLVAQVAGIYIDVGSITSRVENTEQQIGKLEDTIENLNLEGVSYFEAYFCVWNSATDAPPDNADWTLADPQIGDGEYKWARYLLYYEDGHTEWTTPYCMTDNYMRTEISLIEQTTTGISESVNSVITWLGDGYTGAASLSTLISQAVDESSADIWIRAQAAFATPTDIADAEAAMELYVTDSLSQITLTASGGIENGNAVISMTVGGDTKTASIDLAGIRYAFRDDNSSITIAAGLVQFGGGTFAVESDNLRITTNGEISSRWTVSGSVYREALLTTGSLSFYYQGTEAGRLVAPGGAEWAMEFELNGPLKIDHHLHIGDTSTDNYLYTQYVNKYCQLQCGVWEDGTRGLFDYNQEIWLVCCDSDQIVMLGTDSRETYIRGDEISINNSTTVYGNVTVTTCTPTMTFGYSGDSYGMRTSGLWITSTDQPIIGIRGEYYGVISVGNGDDELILYGRGVYLNGESEAVTSDISIKEGVQPLSTGSLFDNLTPREYALKRDEKNKTHMGFVAQEVEEAMQKAGMNPADYGLTDETIDEDGETVKAIRYDEFIPLLVYEIQQLKKEITKGD